MTGARSRRRGWCRWVPALWCVAAPFVAARPGAAQEPAGTAKPEIADALSLLRQGLADSALRVVARVPAAARDPDAETARALALHALGRRYAADSAVRRAVLFGADSAPPGAAVELAAAWRAARLGVPRVTGVTLQPAGDSMRFAVALSARDGSQPRGRAAWWLATDGRVDTLCVGAADAGCAWDGRLRGTRAPAGAAILGVAISTGDLDVPVLTQRRVEVRWEAPAPLPAPPVLPETVLVVQRDLERRARWWRAAAVAGGAGALAMGGVAVRAGAWAVDTPVDAPVRRVAAAAYVAGGVTLVGAAVAAGWAAMRPWTRSARFVRPDVVAANAARRAAWERAEAARAAGNARVRLEVMP